MLAFLAHCCPQDQPEALVLQAPDAKRRAVWPAQLFHLLSADCWMPPVQSQATEASRDGSTVLAKADGGRRGMGSRLPEPTVLREASSWTGAAGTCGGCSGHEGWGHPTPSLSCWCCGSCMHHG